MDLSAEDRRETIYKLESTLFQIVMGVRKEIKAEGEATVLP